jgi:general secretion pathway protein A
VPRLINVLCDRAMLGAFVEGKRRIESPIVRKAANEVLPEEGLQAPRRGWRWLAAAVALAALGLGTYYLVYLPSSRLPTQALHRTEQAPVPTVPEPVARNPVEQSPVPSEAQVETPRVSSVATDTLPDPFAEMSAVEEPEAKLPEALRADAVDQALRASDLELALARSGQDAASSAWAALYRLWGIQADVAGDEQACAQAPGVGLRCLRGAGSWNMLSHLDRPAMLLLNTRDGQRIPVVLLELLGADVRLYIDGRELVVPVDELQQAWLGHYRILWKTPPRGSAVLRPGQSGSDVTWLRDQLQKVTGMTAITPNPAVYDDGLRELVLQFQREQGLQADGVAGPQTLIHLNNLVRQLSVPRLGVVSG